MTHSTLHCYGPRVTAWVDSHSGRKSRVMVTSGMVQFGRAITAREIVMFNMEASLKKPMDSDKLHAMVHFKTQQKLAFGAAGAVVMERC